MSARRTRRVQGRRQVLHVTCRRREVQAEWHQSTGYVPITLRRLRADQESGFYEKNPGLRHRDPAAQQQAAHRQFEGRCASAISSQIREHHRRGAGSGLEPARRTPSRRSTRRSSAATSILRKFQSRQQVVARGRRQQQPPSPLPFAASPRHHDGHGKARRLPLGVAALRAGRAADRDHRRLLLLARVPGGVVLVSAAGRLRAADRVRRPRATSSSCSTTRATSTRSGSRPSSASSWPAPASCFALLLAMCQPRHPRRARLQDVPDLAVRGGLRGRRRGLRFPVRAVGRHHHLCPQAGRHRLELGAAR